MMPPACTAAPGRTFASTACKACGVGAGDECPRKTHTEKVIQQAGGVAKVGLARGTMAK